MAYTVSYQLVNETGSQLNLVGTSQFPSGWISTVPSALSTDSKPIVTSNGGSIGVTIVFGYALEGYSTSQFWVVSNMGDMGPQVGQLAPSGHSIQVNIQGNSEDGYLVTLTYKS